MEKQAKSVTDISIESLCRHGIEGILLDLDNTIVAWGEDHIAYDMRRWIQKGKAHGLRFCLLSNSYTDRARRIAGDLRIPVIAPTLKPRPFGYMRAMNLLGINAKHTVMIGDQLFTDVKHFGITEIRERRSLALSKRIMLESPYLREHSGYKLYDIMQ